MKTHRGFLMVWALAGITVILILAGSVALTLSQAMRREVRMEIATDEALIVQEALEQGEGGGALRYAAFHLKRRHGKEWENVPRRSPSGRDRSRGSRRHPSLLRSHA